MSQLPFRLLANAILVPSGDHAGDASIAELKVRRETLPPSASMTCSSPFPSRVLVKAILSRLGDHSGSASTALALVSRVGAPPCGSTA